MIVVGRIGRPFGVHGWVHITSYTEPLDAILEYIPWSIETRPLHTPACPRDPVKTDWKTVERDVKMQLTAGGQIRAQFPGCTTIELARTYTNLLIGVERERFPALAPDEYYWADLEGLDVVNQAGENLGKVSHLFSTGANDVVVVKGDRERLLPYIKSVILKVDLVERKIQVDWDSEF